MQFKDRASRNKPVIILLAAGALAVCYFAVCVSPYSEGGLPALIGNFSQISFLPSDIIWLSRTPHTIAVCEFIYAVAAMIALSYRRRYHRAGVEEGSADYANKRRLRREFNSSSPQRIVFTKNFAVSTTKEDTYRHNRNYNSVIIGGPGAGKTTGFVYPNILEKNGSYVVIDPAGEVCRNTAKPMERDGYKVKTLDLVNPNRSWGYNPFSYIRQSNEAESFADDDIQKIVTAIYKATQTPNSQTLDPFWDEAGKMLLSALMYLVYYFGAENEKNFRFIMDVLRAGRDKEGDDSKSPLDLLFMALERKYPDHIAVRYYRNAVSGAENTMRSVYITLISRLQKFEIESVALLTERDELELEKLGEEKTVLYCIIPDNDTSYNFIISMLYVQLFQVLYAQADNFYHGRLPLLVHVMMDEFANVNVPEDFLHILGTCRKRNVAISIILQNLAQLKEKYKDGWEDIIGQCSFLLYLGGNELSTHEYISKSMGRETIDTSTFGRNFGTSGSSSTNYQFKGRELLTPDEVRILPYRYALILITNSPPFIDEKINIFKAKIAENTAIRGDKRMEYSIPLRDERLHKPKEEKKADNDIFTATSFGKKPHSELELIVNSSLTSSEVFGEIINSYSLDFDFTDLENFTTKEQKK